MKTKKILAGALAAAVVTTSLPGMGVPVFAEGSSLTTDPNCYTADTPFVFPTEVGGVQTLEAELATTLWNEGTDEQYPMQVVRDDQNKTAIHNMAAGGKDHATYAYTAGAGLYEVVADCQCGATNTMVLSEANNKISRVSVAVAKTKNNQDQLIWGKSNKFLLWVNESGSGTLKITSDKNQDAPRIDRLTITKVESPYYVGENRFRFPTDSASVTLEAEYGILTNATSSDDNGQWPAEVASGTWANNGYFVNSVNTGDSVAYAYHAEKPGIYEFEATYRSGSNDNHYTWSSDNGNIVDGSVQAGMGDKSASVTQTKRFKVAVKEAGDGILTFAAPVPATGVKNMAQTDKFDIRLVVDKSDLVSALEDANALARKLDNYEDGETKTAFTAALDDANRVNINYADTLTQDDVNNAVTALNNAKAALVLKTRAIQITTQPTKKVYNLNEAVNTEGLVVKAVKADDTTETLASDAYTVTLDSATRGTKTLKVTLTANAELIATTNVEVVDGASLDAKVAKAEEKKAGKHYTSATKDVFEEKLNAAKTVQDDIKAANGDGTVEPSATAVTADRVAQATAALDTAMNDLEEMYKVTVPTEAEITVAEGVENEKGNDDNTNKWVYVPVATKVTVNAPKENTAGEKFAAWTWKEQKLSESNEYAFYVVGDMKLQMTYDANTVNEEAVVLVGSTKYTEKKRSFIAKRSVSKKCKKVLEYGVVVTDQKGWDTYYKEGIANKKDLVKGNTRTKCSKKVATEKVLLAYNGTFVANLRVTDKNEKWYGRAYVRYLDENNQEQTYYADNVIKY